METKTLSEDASSADPIAVAGQCQTVENLPLAHRDGSGTRGTVIGLPTELLQHQDEMPEGVAESWHEQLAGWANRQLAEGQSNVLRQALPLFESIMIEAALRHTGGRKAEAAELLGWGRNTLTRKLKDLDLPAA